MNDKEKRYVVLYGVLLAYCVAAYFNFALIGVGMFFLFLVAFLMNVFSGGWE